MGPAESKTYQLRVRVTEEERDLLKRLRAARARGETISDLVREAIALLVRAGAGEQAAQLNPKLRTQVERLAVLLKREPRQVEEACIEGILDLIEAKCEVPLIVMETHLHLKYRNRDEKEPFPWNTEGAPSEKEAVPPDSAPSV